MISVGFVDIGVEALREGLATVAAQERVRHQRIATVVESTSLRCMYELRTEHEFTSLPREITARSPESLLAALARSS